MSFSRREFVKYLSATPVLGTGLGATCFSRPAMSADASGYKALVCIFLYGGLDNNDFLLPYDNEYSSFQRIRQSMLAEQGASRALESLLPLNPSTGTADGSRWALPPEMPISKSLFDSGNAALVSNVGPLIEPITRQQFLDETAPLPPRLFSHNDQQATWQASAPEGAQYGWGGLFADAFLRGGPTDEALAFTTINTSEVGPFLTGRRAYPYSVNTGGASRIWILGGANEDNGGDSFQQRLRRHMSGANYGGTHVIRRDMAAGFASALDTNSRYNQARSASTPLNTQFPEGWLSAQLRAVANTIEIRQQLGVSRQVFFVGFGGFDTHSAQATDLPRLLAEIDSSVGAFYSATEELGVADEVTLFTASDFGRTLAVNGDGTDHGWGGHHLVVGGAVQGQQLFGAPPPPVLDNPLDAGAGASIPQFSVEQFAEPLGQWFGLNEDELLNALPALSNFDRGALPLFG